MIFDSVFVDLTKAIAVSGPFIFVYVQTFYKFYLLGFFLGPCVNRCLYLTISVLRLCVSYSCYGSREAYISTLIFF